MPHNILMRACIFLPSSTDRTPELRWGRWELLESCDTEEQAKTRLAEYKESAKRDAIRREFKIER